MRVERETHGRATLLVVTGQVDMYTSPELRRHLRKALGAQSTPLVVDLSGVSFIDSSGLATLIEALKGAMLYTGKLRLVGLTPAVRSLFELSNLTSIFEICETKEEGLQS